MCSSLILVAAIAQPATPIDAVNELLQTDRAFSSAAAALPAADALGRMFTDDVIMPAPGNRFVEGRTQAIEALRTNPDNVTGRVTWTPIRGGVSSDGQHGFTFGYMTLTRADKTTAEIKYLAYWIRQPDGWRVAAYKRRPRPATAVAMQPMPPAVPERRASGQNPPHAALVKSLIDTEREFSDLAQEIGIGGAFTKYGREDAVNMGGPTDAGFVVGAPSIGQSVAVGSPAGKSPVSWSADRAIAAPSGDLGITFGRIRSNDPAKAGEAGAPFFTIWWRTSPSDPWRYIAE